MTYQALIAAACYRLRDLIENRKVDFVVELRELEALRDGPVCPLDVLSKEIASTKKVSLLLKAPKGAGASNRSALKLRGHVIHHVQRHETDLPRQ